MVTNLKTPQIEWKWNHNLQNLWDTGKAVLREGFIAVGTNTKEEAGGWVSK